MKIKVIFKDDGLIKQTTFEKILLLVPFQTGKVRQLYSLIAKRFNLDINTFNITIDDDFVIPQQESIEILFDLDHIGITTKDDIETILKKRKSLDEQQQQSPSKQRTLKKQRLLSPSKSSPSPSSSAKKSNYKLSIKSPKNERSLVSETDSSESDDKSSSSDSSSDDESTSSLSDDEKSSSDTNNGSSDLDSESDNTEPESSSPSSSSSSSEEEEKKEQQSKDIKRKTIAKDTSTATTTKKTQQLNTPTKVSNENNNPSTPQNSNQSNQNTQNNQTGNHGSKKDSVNSELLKYCSTPPVSSINGSSTPTSGVGSAQKRKQYTDKQLKKFAYNEELSNNSYYLNASDYFSTGTTLLNGSNTTNNTTSTTTTTINNVNSKKKDYSKSTVLKQLPMVGDHIAFQKHIFVEFNLKISNVLEGIVKSLTESILSIELLDEFKDDQILDNEYFNDQGYLETPFHLLINPVLLSNNNINNGSPLPISKTTSTTPNNNIIDRFKDFQSISPDIPIYKQLRSSKNKSGGGGRMAGGGMLSKLLQTLRKETQESSTTLTTDT